MSYHLLSVGVDAKTIKGNKHGYLTGILFLAPANVSGVNVCANSTEGCRESCLFTAGFGVYSHVINGRSKRNILLQKHKEAFLYLLDEDINTLIRIAKKRGKKPCVRLNGTSDLPWENLIDMSKYDCQFYDYTKSWIRMNSYLCNEFPPNYHLTFSRSEVNENMHTPYIIDMGGNVAVVFNTRRKDKLPNTYLRYDVIDGDKSDLRFLDPKNVIVGLRAKGRARKDSTGFVVKV